MCDHVFIENDVVIGDRVTLKGGVQVWDGITIEDDVFVGPNVTFTNHISSRSKDHPQTFARTIIRKGASLGANCTIFPGVTIGINARVGVGAVVTRSIPPNAIVLGNPAKIIGYVDATPLTMKAESVDKIYMPGVVETSVKVSCCTPCERWLIFVEAYQWVSSSDPFHLSPSAILLSMTYQQLKPEASTLTVNVISSSWL